MITISRRRLRCEALESKYKTFREQSTTKETTSKQASSSRTDPSSSYSHLLLHQLQLWSRPEHRGSILSRSQYFNFLHKCWAAGRRVFCATPPRNLFHDSTSDFGKLRNLREDLRILLSPGQYPLTKLPPAHDLLVL